MKSSIILLAVLGTALAEVFLEERFTDGKYTNINNDFNFFFFVKSTYQIIFIFSLIGISDKWVQSTHKGAEAGKFEWTAGKFYGDADKDKGIQTSQDAKFYALSTEFKPFSNKDKPLVVQFTVKHEQNIDCGGGYAKLFDCSLDQTDMHGDSPYLIMFGKYYFWQFHGIF